jgi:hypothetical protein
MHRTTINVPDSLFQRARIKALRENLAVSKVIRDLLAHWVTGEIELSSKERSREKLVALARSAQGMWTDRDPDDYLVAGRVGLRERDEELENAWLDA